MSKNIENWLFFIGVLINAYGRLNEEPAVEMAGLCIMVIFAVIIIFKYPIKVKQHKNEFKAFNEDTGELKMQRVPDGVHYSKIAKLYVKSDDFVSENDLIIEVETDKVILEVVSPVSARVKTVNKSLGQSVESGEILIVFEV